MTQAGSRNRLLKGLGANAYGRVVVMAGQVLAVPVLITRWGALGYGEWVTLTALASYITYANVGVPGAVRADMAMSFGAGGRDEMQSSFQSSLALVAGLGALVTGLFLLAIWTLPLGAVLRPGFISLNEARLVGSLLCLQIALTLVIGVFQAALSSVGRYGLANFMESNRQAAEFVLLFVLVGLFAQRPGVVALLFPLTALVHLGVLVGAVVRHCPWVLQRPWSFRSDVLRRLAKPMFGVVAMSFGYYSMTVQAPRLVLAAVLGPAAVSVYAVTMMLMRIVRTPIDVIAHAPNVELSLAHGGGDAEGARRLLARTIQATFWFALLLLPFVAVLGPGIVHIWTRGRVEVAPALLVAGGLSTLAFSIGLPCQEALMSRGRLGDVTVWFVITAAPFVGLLLVEAKLAGLLGVAASVVLLDLTYALLSSRKVIELFGFGVNQFWRPLARPPMLPAEAQRLVQRRIGRRRVA